MNKLQLYITKGGLATATLVEINPTAEGRRAAGGVGRAVEAMDYPADGKVVFYVVINVRDGYAIHVVRTIPPRRPNHIDATVFVPKDADIFADDLAEILESVSSTMLSPAVTDAQMNRLRDAFAREYDVLDKASRIKPSAADGGYAALPYDGDGGLRDIIDGGIYRRDWSRYAGVVLYPSDIEPCPGAVTLLGHDDGGDDGDAETATPVGTANDVPTHNYLFAIPISTPDGRSALEFEIESTKPIRRSPIAGYECVSVPVEGSDTPQRLRRSGGALHGDAARWLWAAAGLAAGVLLTLFAGLFTGRGEDAAPAEEKTSATPAAATQAPPKTADKKKTQPTEATAYLDNNRTWRRDDMEKIAGLKGLFDDMDNYCFDRLTDGWAAELAASKNFAKVAKAAAQARSKHVDPRRESAYDPTYTRPGNKSLSWLAYTYWIDP